MTAIILAAGVGKRLLDASGGKPKCLIRIGGVSLLARLLQQLANAGVQDAVVVVGFGGEVVKQEIGAGPDGLRVSFVDNPRFREGAILSLWSAQAHLGGPVLVMDADVLSPQWLIDRLVRSPHENCFLLDAGVQNTGEEQMLLVRDGWVRNIVRGGAPGYELMGESIGFLKLSADAAALLRDLLRRKLDAGHTDIEHEEVYPDLLSQRQVGFERVDGAAWTEIDFPEDVTRAEREILPRLDEVR